MLMLLVLLEMVSLVHCLDKEADLLFLSTYFVCHLIQNFSTGTI